MAGDCYAANGRWMIGQDDSYRLVHGVAILATDGKPFGHCWIEKGNQILDFSNGKKISLSKNKYYELGGIPVKGHKLYKYKYLEAAKLMVKYELWGPWESKPPR